MYVQAWLYSIEAHDVNEMEAFGKGDLCRFQVPLSNVAGTCTATKRSQALPQKQPPFMLARGCDV